MEIRTKTISPHKNCWTMTSQWWINMLVNWIFFLGCAGGSDRSVYHRIGTVRHQCHSHVAGCNDPISAVSLCTSITFWFNLLYSLCCTAVHLHFVGQFVQVKYLHGYDNYYELLSYYHLGSSRAIFSFSRASWFKTSTSFFQVVDFSTIYVFYQPLKALKSIFIGAS